MAPAIFVCHASLKTVSEVLANNAMGGRSPVPLGTSMIVLYVNGGKGSSFYVGLFEVTGVSGLDLIPGIFDGRSRHHTLVSAVGCSR